MSDDRLEAIRGRLDDYAMAEVRGGVAWLIAEVDKLRERIDEQKQEWQEATGLLNGGDPGGVTPEHLREYIGRADSLIRQCRHAIDCLMGDSDIDGDTSPEMRAMQAISQFEHDYPDE